MIEEWNENSEVKEKNKGKKAKKEEKIIMVKIKSMQLVLMKKRIW